MFFEREVLSGMGKYKKFIVCPFTRQPDKECYCVNINSSKVFYVIEYCGGQFLKCPIYKKLVSKDVIEPESILSDEVLTV